MDVMKIRGADQKLRYETEGTVVRDVRFCDCFEVLPGTYCVACGHYKPEVDDSQLRSQVKDVS